jgi:hypothetical protein
MSLSSNISGFLFLFIIAVNIVSNIFGYETFSDTDAKDKLTQINNSSKKFKIGFLLIFIEHVSIIFLAITLFIAFGFLNLFLGGAWLIARIGEAMIQIYDKKDYWALLNLAERYSRRSGEKKEELIDIAHNIQIRKNFVFKFTQVLFSIGTLAYSILFVVYRAVPAFIGWFGIGAAIIYGVGNILAIFKPAVKSIWNIGGLFVLVFEIILGGWLLLFS